ncbi:MULTISPECIES: GlxA family transcriptional regulator [unclassified Shewanella]|uniref:GlxA family transcriptional regulator n=1 Tax=unclassified Shewanella TaxID=196818 RepID=UPI001BBB6491|nr:MULTISPECIES: helix-turn-helix domain-containing protein [unclassified Shewanella]GIU14096.1 AraC family transcriptional regulator [Shewanella sp. MBTL60-112-B1]GIU29917.1 AraC family transcriptional regulator [Shewanella sp. MBTL60-112-B2]
MKRIVVLAADNAVAGGILSFMDVFSFSNTYWKVTHPDADEVLFECAIISPDGEPIKSDHNMLLPVIAHDEAEHYLSHADAIVVASAAITNRKQLNAYLDDFQPHIATLKKFAQTNKPIAAYCSGTLMLAASGLLDDKKATCVWWLAELFRRSFPRVDLCSEHVVMNDGQYYTAGATSANLSLALQLVQKLAGEQIAMQMAKVLLIDPNRTSQQAFMTLDAEPQHKDELVTRIQDWMQLHLKHHLQLDDIADKFALGKRTLIRRFKKAINETPASYIQRLRVDEAKRLLETTELAIEQIVEQVGYEDVSSFRKLFIQTTSLSPRAYRQKFNTHDCC